MLLEHFKPINNYVLLKPVVDGTERTHGKIILGVGRAAKDQYLKNYIYRHLEVIKIPEKLDFPRSRTEFADSGYAFRYRTELEIKPGDTVWVKLRSIRGAIPIYIDKERYVMVHYADCFVAQRRNTHRDLARPSKNMVMKDDTYWDVIPLNGNVVCEKIYKKGSELSVKEKYEIPGKLKVKYVGKTSPSYFTILEEKLAEVEIPPIKIKHKDVVQCDGPYINIEGEYFHDFNGESQPVVIHSSKIAAVLNGYN